MADAARHRTFLRLHQKMRHASSCCPELYCAKAAKNYTRFNKPVIYAYEEDLLLIFSCKRAKDVAVTEAAAEERNGKDFWKELRARALCMHRVDEEGFCGPDCRNI